MAHNTLKGTGKQPRLSETTRFRSFSSNQFYLWQFLSPVVSGSLRVVVVFGWWVAWVVVSLVVLGRLHSRSTRNQIAMASNRVALASNLLVIVTFKP